MGLRRRSELVAPQHQDQLPVSRRNRNKELRQSKSRASGVRPRQHSPTRDCRVGTGARKQQIMEWPPANRWQFIPSTVRCHIRRRQMGRPCLSPCRADSPGTGKDTSKRRKRDNIQHETREKNTMAAADTGAGKKKGRQIHSISTLSR